MVSPSLVMKRKHVGRAVNGCQFQGYLIIFKVKMPFVLRVLEKDTVSWKEFDGLSEKKKEDSDLFFKCVDILTHAAHTCTMWVRLLSFVILFLMILNV